VWNIIKHRVDGRSRVKVRGDLPGVQMYEGHVWESAQRSRLIEHTSFFWHGLGLHGVVTSVCRYRYRLSATWCHNKSSPWRYQFSMLLTRHTQGKQEKCLYLNNFKRTQTS